MSEAQITTDHRAIRSWAESRDGSPAKVETDKPGGVLRIDFGEPEDSLTQISWDEFFQIFENSKLAFLHQDITENGGTSRFNKFVDRDEN
jgi:hypothetical protein